MKDFQFAIRENAQVYQSLIDIYERNCNVSEEESKNYIKLSVLMRKLAIINDSTYLTSQGAEMESPVTSDSPQEHETYHVFSRLYRSAGDITYDFCRYQTNTTLEALKAHKELLDSILVSIARIEARFYIW